MFVKGDNSGKSKGKITDVQPDETDHLTQTHVHPTAGSSHPTCTCDVYEDRRDVEHCGGG